MPKILWFDNDKGMLQPFVEELRRAGHEVNQVTSITGIEESLRADDYDLLILDVMIPTRSAAEEADYPPSETDFGHKTGLVLYRKNRERLKAAGTRVLVLTVRLDLGIVAEFKQTGLPEDNFATKVTLREADDFIEKVNEVLGRDA